MKTLVVTQSAAEARAIVGALPTAEHQVEAVKSPEEAQALFERTTPFDAMIIEWASKASQVSFIQATRERFPKLAVVAMVDTATSAIIDGLEGCGVHDFIKKPATARELSYRVKRATFIANVAEQVPEDALAVKETSDLFAWANLEGLVRNDITAMVGSEAMTAAHTSSLPQGAAAEIAIVHATAGATVRFTIAFAESALTTLASLLLGEESPTEAVRGDIAKEIANTIGGAFQRAAASEGETLTIGLPSISKGRLLADDVRSFTVRVADLSFVVAVEIFRQRVEHVAPTGLREGMVVVRDVMTTAGALLMSGGTRLTQNNAQRLAKLLPPHQMLQVAMS